MFVKESEIEVSHLSSTPLDEPNFFRGTKGRGVLNRAEDFAKKIVKMAKR